MAIKANQTKINKNKIKEILKFIIEKKSEILVNFSKIFKKLNQEFSKIFHIEIIGITAINPQTKPETNFFLDKFTQSIYEKIYHQIIIGIRAIIDIQIIEKKVSSIKNFYIHKYIKILA